MVLTILCSGQIYTNLHILRFHPSIHPSSQRNAFTFSGDTICLRTLPAAAAAEEDEDDDDCAPAVPRLDRDDDAALSLPPPSITPESTT